MASNYFFAAVSSISLMVMATSGHIVQHSAQKMQSSGRAWYAGKYPFVLISLEISRTFFGQTFTHNPHPLHRSLSTKCSYAIGWNSFAKF
jgi:hypothetical protein